MEDTGTGSFCTMLKVEWVLVTASRCIRGTSDMVPAAASSIKEAMLGRLRDRICREMLYASICRFGAERFLSTTRRCLRYVLWRLWLPEGIDFAMTLSTICSSAGLKSTCKAAPCQSSTFSRSHVHCAGLLRIAERCLDDRYGICSCFVSCMPFCIAKPSCASSEQKSVAGLGGAGFVAAVKTNVFSVGDSERMGPETFRAKPKLTSSSSTHSSYSPSVVLNFGQV